MSSQSRPASRYQVSSPGILLGPNDPYGYLWGGRSSSLTLLLQNDSLNPDSWTSSPIRPHFIPWPIYSPTHIQTCPLAGPSKLACMSFSELEAETTRRFSDLQIHTMETEHLLDVTVSNFPLFVQPAHILGTINRVLLPTTKPSPTLTQHQLHWKMNHRILKSGPLWPTRTIPRCLHPLCALGLLALFGLSFSPLSTKFSCSDTLPCLSVWFVIFDSYLS